MFSIILPLYNKAPYVAKAIQSVLSQTYQAFELIVINDGSTDSSEQVAQQLLETLPNAQLYTQQNQGASTARNKGVELAKYPYLCFLDADDWWAPTFLEEMKAMITEYPDAGIYGTNYYIVKNGNNKIAPIGVDKEFLKGYINYCQVYAKTLCMPLTSISVVIPIHIFDAMKGFKPQLKLGEDFELWIRIALQHQVALLNKPLAYYNQDVEVQHRAVSTQKFYKPEEHMLFMDYQEWMGNKDFRFLYEKLALYGLLPYYLNGVHSNEVNSILKHIDLKKSDSPYAKFYQLPKFLVKIYFVILQLGYKIKVNIIQHKQIP